MKPRDYVEEVQWLKDGGENAAAISFRLGVKPGSIAKALYRAGRPDLAAPFNALHWSTREVNRTKLCGPCKLDIHQAHRKHRDGRHLCHCGFCRLVSDNVCHTKETA